MGLSHLLPAWFERARLLLAHAPTLKSMQPCARDAYQSRTVLCLHVCAVHHLDGQAHLCARDPTNAGAVLSIAGIALRGWRRVTRCSPHLLSLAACLLSMLWPSESALDLAAHAAPIHGIERGHGLQPHGRVHPDVGLVAGADVDKGVERLGPGAALGIVLKEEAGEALVLAVSPPQLEASRARVLVVALRAQHSD